MSSKALILSRLAKVILLTGFSDRSLLFSVIRGVLQALVSPVTGDRAVLQALVSPVTGDREVLQALVSPVTDDRGVLLGSSIASYRRWRSAAGLEYR